MSEIKRLMNKVKRLNKGNRLLAMVHIGDGVNIEVSYSVDGATSRGGTVYCADKDAVDKFISDLMERYRIFSENCTVIVDDLDE